MCCIDPLRSPTEEAIWICRVLATQLPEEPEVLGLLALMLHLEARRTARRVEGRYVPLAEQDVAKWRRDLMDEAERVLRAASAGGKIGRFQLEAAIQSAHAARAYVGKADWAAIVILYQGLAELTGSPVAHLNAAAAIAQRDGPAAGWDAVGAAAASFPTLRSYQPYWALLADLCAKLGRTEAARAAYDEAIARERDKAVVAFLAARREAL